MDDDLNAQPGPPEDLSAEAQELWNKIYESVTLDVAATVILDELCRQHDRLRQAREIIKKEGMLIAGRYGRKTNPACGIERDASAAMMRAWRLLGLDLQPPGQTGFDFGGDR